MKDKLVFVDNNTDLIIDEVNKNTPLIIVKKFFNHITCKSMINFCIKNHTLDDHRKNNINKPTTIIKRIAIPIMPAKISKFLMI